jgi:hypothetical protein
MRFTRFISQSRGGNMARDIAHPKHLSSMHLALYLTPRTARKKGGSREEIIYKKYHEASFLHISQVSFLT